MTSACHYDVQRIAGVAAPGMAEVVLEIENCCRDCAPSAAGPVRVNGIVFRGGATIGG